MSTAKPSKRARSADDDDDRDEGSLDLQEDPDLWFDDGNILIICEQITFRVHRSILSLNSQIFKDMFTLNEQLETESTAPSPVHLLDAGQDVRHFLKALYNRR